MGHLEVGESAIGTSSRLVIDLHVHARYVDIVGHIGYTVVAAVSVYTPQMGIVGTNGIVTTVDLGYGGRILGTYVGKVERPFVGGVFGVQSSDQKDLQRILIAKSDGGGFGEIAGFHVAIQYLEVLAEAVVLGVPDLEGGREGGQIPNQGAIGDDSIGFLCCRRLVGIQGIHGAEGDDGGLVEHHPKLQFAIHLSSMVIHLTAADTRGKIPDARQLAVGASAAVYHEQVFAGVKLTAKGDIPNSAVLNIGNGQVEQGLCGNSGLIVCIPAVNRQGTVGTRNTPRREAHADTRERRVYLHLKSDPSLCLWNLHGDRICCSIDEHLHNGGVIRKNIVCVHSVLRYGCCGDLRLICFGLIRSRGVDRSRFG